MSKRERKGSAKEENKTGRQPYDQTINLITNIKVAHLVLNGDVNHDKDVVPSLGLGPNVELHDPEGHAGSHALF